MSTGRLALLCAAIGVVYAAVLAITGDPVPGVVGGVLLAVLAFLVVRRVQQYNAAKRREAARRRGGNTS